MDRFSDPTTGFEASVYDYDGKTVIAYAGTLPGFVDIKADALPGLGIPESQVKQAAEFYEAVKRTYGGEIVLTGHSPGSGLAGMVETRYGRLGTLADISFTPATGILGASGFGTAAQALQSLASLSDGSSRLS